MPTIGVYMIENMVNGKFYIGSSVDVETRLYKHRWGLEKGNHHCIHLQRAWNKYGNDSFEFKLFVETPNEEEARRLEQRFLDEYQGMIYNVSQSASGGDLLSYHPNKDEIRQRITESKRLLDINSTPEERKQRYSRPGESNPIYGTTRTEETKRKISEANKGNQYRLGKKHTEESKQKMSEYAKTRTGEKNPFYGKTHTEEAKRKNREKQLGKIPTNARPVKIDNVVYPSATEASRALGVVAATILNRIKNPKFENYNYVE